MFLAIFHYLLVISMWRWCSLPIIFRGRPQMIIQDFRPTQELEDALLYLFTCFIDKKRNCENFTRMCIYIFIYLQKSILVGKFVEDSFGLLLEWKRLFRWNIHTHASCLKFSSMNVDFGHSFWGVLQDNPCCWLVAHYTFWIKARQILGYWKTLFWHFRHYCNYESWTVLNLYGESFA